MQLHPRCRAFLGLLAAAPVVLAAAIVPAPALAAPVSSAPAAVPAVAAVLDPASVPDPTQRGDYEPAVIQEAKLGTASLQEPSSAGDPPTAGTVQEPVTFQIRGQLFYPADRSEPSPLIVLVHGNHGSCDAGTNNTTATCATYKRNEAGYAYLGENLATWGYTVFSLSQDQLMLRQDNPKGKGMHQRRLLIAAALDALSLANTPGGVPASPNADIGTTLSGRLDMSRIGMMGHSRGGDAVSSFIDYNRIRTDGPRYPLRGVISLAPVDYERKAPYGMPYMTILPFCDGDVSNLQGARLFERSQYVNPGDPFPRIQVSQLGAIHNWYNTVWYADGGADGQANNDAACGNSAPFAASNVHPNNLRLSGSANPVPIVPVPGTTNGSQGQDKTNNYVIDNRDTFNPEVNTKISGDPARMGDQEKIGLATMAAFFRRYIGGEGAFEPYMTGELSDTDSHLQIPASACPTSVSGTRIGCEEYVSTSYQAPPSERVDVIRPEILSPLDQNALGGSLTGSGFASPYLAGGGATVPAPTPGGYDWCNPEPDDFAPAQLGKGTLPTSPKACPLPAANALGGQSNGMRENAPVNHSYGRQLALAWEQGSAARLSAEIPTADRDVSDLKALALQADVNFWDQRNPGAGARGTSTAPAFADEGPTSYDPASTTQDFLITLRDTDGNAATVHAGDERWGNALHMSTGTNTPNTHVVLEQIRVPLAEFEAQGVDVSSLDAIDLDFGAVGTPQSGSIQLADVRFQEADVDAPAVLSDGYAADGPGTGAPTSGPDPSAQLAAYDRTPGNAKLLDTVGVPAGTTVWTVDDDRAQCPEASTTSIQRAVDLASPWDTIVVCDGTYQESSTPVAGPGNPVATDARNGLTITKPLKIKGAGAGKVTIMPDQSLATLAGQAPYLRDGGGNVVTVSRQSLGSTDTNEMFVDISGVTVTSGTTFAEAGIAFFGASGRVSESVVGPMRVATDQAELDANPRSWGIVKTGFVQGSGPGTVENEVTVANSLVTGYQNGGILFDGARGPDDRPAGTTRTGIEQHGYVVGSVVRGTPGALVPPTGVKYTSGADGFVRGSRITGNYSRTNPAASYGVLLTDARTEPSSGTAVPAVNVSGSIVTGNGWAVYNADATNTGVRQGAPVTVASSFLGQGAPTPGTPTDPATGTEGVSGPDANGAATVVVTGRAATPSPSVPTSAGPTADGAPSSQIIDLGTAPAAAGTPLRALVRARDDLGVRSVTLLADGAIVASTDDAPYALTWTPSASSAGREVELVGVVTDSAGQQTRSAPVDVTVAAAPVDPPTPTPPTPTPPTPVPPATPVSVSVGKVTPLPGRGLARLTVRVSTPGVLELEGAKTRDRRVRVASGVRRVTVLVQPTARYARILDRRGRLGVRVRLTLTAPSDAASTTAQVVLRRR